MSTERDPYTVLGVGGSATTEQIAAAYRRLARRHHPDVSAEPDAERRMAEINAAWAALRDPDRRAARHRANGDGAAPAWSAADAGRTAPGETWAGDSGRPPQTSNAAAGRVAWRRGPHGEGAAGPPPGSPRGSVLPFGRHIGWSLGEVARTDPGYLTWLAERREGAPWRDEIRDLLASMRPADDPGPPVPRRRLFG
jgi:curved DNA-binding protein CbpA